MDIPRGAVKPNHLLFIERKGITDKISNLAEKGTSVLLTGPYMTGKSTILLSVSQRLQSRKSAKDIFIDLSIYSHLELMPLFQAIYHEIGQSPELTEEFQKQDNLAEREKIDSPWNFGLAILELTQKLSVPLVIIFDEIQRLATTDSNDTLIRFVLALRWITERSKRPPFEKETPIAFILSGVIDPNEIIDSSRSPFNTAERVMVFDLSKVEIIHFMQRSGVLGENGQVLTSDLVDGIFEETGGNPYLVQVFAKRMRNKDLPSIKELLDLAQQITGEFACEFDAVFEKMSKHKDVQELSERILSGEKIKYTIWDADVRYARLAGIIREDKNGYCCIRGRIYERILRSLGWGNLLGEHPENATK